MLSRSQVGLTVIIQGLGAASTVLTVIVVSARFGTGGQGYWASFRSILDVLVVLGVYGLPQAFPFIINRCGVSIRQLERFTLRYFGCAWPPIAAAGSLAVLAGYVTIGGQPGTEIAALALAGAGLVAHGLLRGLALSGLGSTSFNVVSVAPGVIQLVVIALWPIEDGKQLPWAIVLAALLSLLASWMLYRRAVPRYAVLGTDLPLPLRLVLVTGLWWFASLIILALLPAILYQTMLHRQMPVDAVGQFSVALMIVGAALLPVNMVAPLMYKAMTSAATDAERQAGFVRNGRAFMLLAILMPVCCSIGAVGVPWVLGDRFAGVVRIAVVLMVSVPAAYFIRLASNAIAAVGSPRPYTLVLLVRVACTVVPVIALDADLIDFAWYFVAGEYVGAITAALVLRRQLCWPWQAILLRAHPRS